jgi:phage baseplate assembly protein V
MSAIGQELKRAIRKRIGAMINRFLVAAIDDTGLDARGIESHQRVDGTIFDAEALHRGASHFQAYGMSSHPKIGAEGIALQIGGSRGRLAVLNVDDPRARPTGLVEGEVQIYTDEGLVLHAKRGRIVYVRGTTLDLETTGAAKVKSSAGEARLEGTTVVLVGSVTIDGIDWATHAHDATGGTPPFTDSVSGACSGKTGPPV